VKIAVIGGAGVRTPLLISGLARSDLPIAEMALFDVDRDRLSQIAPLARSYFSGVRTYDDVRAAVSDAAFVFVSIRVGGIAARAHDEATAIAHGIVGQETVGPAGFAMAMRTVPHAVAYARAIADAAPRAWIINFTNPVGIVTQAMRHASPRVIGICDTPTELFEEAARALGLDAPRCFFDYFGLNHLGWLREVYCHGLPQLWRLWADVTRAASIYRAPLFEKSFLRELRLLPTEYLFYYYRPRVAFENMTRAEQTRGAAIAALNDALFRDLASAGANAPAVYERYLAERSGTYMQAESGSATPLAPPAASALSGYDKIALAVVRAIHFNTNAIIPLNVRNASTLPDLDADDVVEVPCAVGANGARPLSAGSVPDRVRDLLLRVREYERLTVRAATSRTHADAIDALAANPLVGDRELAERLVKALQIEIAEDTEATGSEQRNGETESR
jgi:6-phospho-beta-glucosidase